MLHRKCGRKLSATVKKFNTIILKMVKFLKTMIIDPEAERIPPIDEVLMDENVEELEHE